MGMPGISEWLIILGVVLLLFGGKKLPQLGGALGESIRNFKKGISDHETLSSSETVADEKSDKQDDRSGDEKG